MSLLSADSFTVFGYHTPYYMDTILMKDKSQRGENKRKELELFEVKLCVKWCQMNSMTPMEDP
ncbi:MAG: hypothetical protein WBX01_13815 [Nitrososphaeraceae archaeon]